MVHYKLIYFDIRGRAEPFRLMFHYAGVPFEDARIKSEQWPELKSKTPFGQIPVLEVDGVSIAQSNAIGHFLARKLNLECKTDVETAKVDAYNELIIELANKVLPYLVIAAGIRPGDKASKKGEFDEALAQYGPQLEKALKASGSGYLAPCGITWVDFNLACLTYTLQKLEPDAVAPFATLKQHVERVHSLSQLKDYLAKRPDVF